MRIASRASLRDSYPILCWVLENTVRRRSQGQGDNGREVLFPLFHAALRSAELSLRVTSHTHSHLGALKSHATIDERFNCLIDPGEEEKGRQWIEEWVREEVGESLRICDAYLSLDDICDLLLMVQQHHRGCDIEVLTCREELRKSNKGNLPWPQVFRDKWRLLTDDEPPQTLVVIAAVEPKGGTPIHDRWFLSGDKGMMNGTSVNGIASKLHHLRRLAPDEASQAQDRLDPYFNRRQKEHGTKEITYKVFSLE